MALPAYSRFGLHTAWPFNILFSILHNKLKLFTTMKKFYMILAAFAAMAMTVQAQDVLQGSIDLGGFETVDENGEGIYDGGAIANSPINYYHCNSGSQIIYTVEDFADFQDKANVKITKLSYKLFNMNAFSPYSRSIKVYMQLIDDAAFGKDEDGNTIYFDFDESAPQLTVEDAGDYVDFYYMPAEFVIDLANAPFEVTPGKNLLVTVVADGEEATDTGSDLSFYADSSRSKRVTTYANDNTPFLTYKGTEDFPKATSMLSSLTNLDLPVTKVDYTYTDQVTAIAEVKAAATTDGAYYNLMGQKFNENSLPAGIYIHNGKKVIVK